MSFASTVVSINASSADLIIVGDPNWDDQELRIDGTIIDEAYTSPPGQSVAASVRGWNKDEGNENMMGIYYMGPNNEGWNKNLFAMTIGTDIDGLMSVTEDYTFGTMTIKYSVVAQTRWIVVLRFEDA